MPQYMPGAQGLYPYRNAGRNDYEGVGNILAGLAGAMQLYKQGRQENRTLGDIVGKPPMQFNPARAVSQQPQGIRGMISGMSPLAALRGIPPRGGGFGSAPQPPMAVPGQMNPLQAMIMNSGMGGMKMRDMKSASEGAPFLKLLMGQNEDDLLLKRLLAMSKIQESESVVDKNKATAKFTNRRPSSGGGKTNALETKAYTMALEEAKADPLYGIAETDDEKQQLEDLIQEAYDRNLRVLSKSGKGGKKKPVKNNDPLGIFK